MQVLLPTWRLGELMIGAGAGTVLQTMVRAAGLPAHSTGSSVVFRALDRPFGMPWFSTALFRVSNDMVLVALLSTQSLARPAPSLLMHVYWPMPCTAPTALPHWYHASAILLLRPP